MSVLKKSPGSEPRYRYRMDATSGDRADQGHSNGIHGDHLRCAKSEDFLFRYLKERRGLEKGTEEVRAEISEAIAS